MISSSSNSISSVNATSSSSKRLSGLVSGLDTDMLVKQLTYGTQAKIDKANQRKQLTVWKQESYREVITALSDFKNKYLSDPKNSSSILNSDFFNTSAIKNTSSFINISGNAKAAQNMVITGITQLAHQADFTSSHRVSAEALSTGSIKESWSPNTITGASMTVNVDGKDYSIKVNNDLLFDATSNVSLVIDSLNESISKNDDLNGKVQFTLNEDNTVTLTSADGDSHSMYIKDGADSLLTGLGLEKSETAAASITGTDINTSAFFSNTLAAGSKLTFKIDGNEHTLTISKAVSLAPDATTAEFASALQNSLTKAINENADLKDKLSVSVNSSTGAVTFNSTSTNWSIVDGSQNMLEGLGLTPSGDNYSKTGTANRDALTKKYLVDTLAGSTLTVSLNGLRKNITFNESEKSQYTTAADLSTYLQEKLKVAYGENKVTVSENSGVLSFKTSELDKTSIFTIESSDAIGILGATGALHVYAGESNRINTNKTLEDISADLSTSLIPQTDKDTYGLSVNGKEFTFKNTDSLDTVISTINNDADANVNIQYSSVTDTFTVTAKNGGANGKVEISDVGGSNLATALFGKQGTDYTVTNGQDAKLNMCFNGNPSDAIAITRSENNFTLDGVNINLLSKTDDTVTSNNPIRFTVENNTDDMYEKIKTFIDDYNGIVKSLHTKVTESKPIDEVYLPLTEEQKKEMSETQIKAWNDKAKQGLHKGDLTLNALNISLRRAMTDIVPSITSALSKIGIATEPYSKDGTLVINEKALKQALSEDNNQIAALFTEKDGIATRLQNVIKKYAGTFGGDGILIAKAGKPGSAKIDQSSFSKSISEYDSQIKTLKRRLETQQEQYYAKFTRLETYLSAMNAQSSWFSSNTEQ